MCVVYMYMTDVPLVYIVCDLTHTHTHTHTQVAVVDTVPRLESKNGKQLLLVNATYLRYETLILIINIKLQ